MKCLSVPFVIGLSWLVMSCHDAGKKSVPINAMPCTLTSAQTTYKAGEIPELKVSIVNNTGKDVYMIGALDGSDVQWRMPFCYFTIEGPWKKPLQKRCGNLNRLSIEDFVFVKNGTTFNPYQKYDDDGFVRDYITSRPETFSQPGRYSIQFHYLTNSTDMAKFMDDMVMQEDTTGLTLLFNNMPKLELTSNSIELEFK